MSDSPSSTSLPLERELAELRRRERWAEEMGGRERLAARRASGILNARERVNKLVDPDSFAELGKLAASSNPARRLETPADGKVSGVGAIGGRPVAIAANDFTVLGASSAVVNGKKLSHLKRLAAKAGYPIVFLGESAGARIPDRMGAEGRAILGQDPTEYLRTRETPWVSAVLGSCFGSSSWYSCMSDFVVMRRGSCMAVASSRVTSRAIGQAVDAEELGGWRLHTKVTGLVDVAVDTDEEAIEYVKRFLSYLPSSSRVVPPRLGPESVVGPKGEVEALIPESSNTVYDVRKIIDAIVDQGSQFPLKASYGRSIVTSLARLNGRTVGVIANNPVVRAGAPDVDACNKATSFIVLCDSFNIPLVFLVDQPGFFVGRDGERQGLLGKIINWMNALSLCTVPKVSVIMRKSYGQGYLNMGGGRNSDVVLAWPTADLGFMDPRTSLSVLGVDGTDPRAEKLAATDTTVWPLAALYEAHSVIAPGDTRRVVSQWLEALVGTSEGVGEHQLKGWPTSIG